MCWCWVPENLLQSTLVRTHPCAHALLSSTEANTCLKKIPFTTYFDYVAIKTAAMFIGFQRSEHHPKCSQVLGI